MKFKIKYLIGISLLSLMVGCEDFLATKSVSDMTYGSYYKEVSDLEGALNAAYSNLLSGSRKGNYAEGLNVLGEAGSDEARCTAQASVPSHQFDEYSTLNSANEILSEVWSNSYKGINITNELISQISNFADESDRIKGIEAEAKFLQALWYFNLVRNFGGVPLMIKPSEASDKFEQKGRDSIEDVYKHIIEYFTFAYNNLGDKEFNGELGRADKYAAAGFLAKVYLQAASSMQLLQPQLTDEIKLGGINSFAWKDTAEDGLELSETETIKYYYEQAAKYAKIVIDYYGGNTCFSKGSLVGTFFPKESTNDVLFEIVMTVGLSPSQAGYFGFMFGPDGKPVHGGGQDIVHPLNCVVVPNYTCSYDSSKKEWSSVDRRFLWTLSTYQYNRQNGKKSILNGSNFGKVCEFMKIHKFSVDINNIPPIAIGAGVNNPVLRLADICLIYAEAVGELSYMGNSSISNEALEYLNVVRTNAGLGSYTMDDVRTAIPITLHPKLDKIATGNKEMKGYVTTTDIEHWRRTIMNERMMELLGEGHRWYDLVRLGLLVPVVTEITGFVSHGDPAKYLKRDVQPHNVFRPIPLREIQLHQGNLIQNYGCY